jgi:PIN domain nuclease of toxin-antitoxin system
MSYLLDTHTFIYSAFDSPELGKKTRKMLLDGGNEISVSVVTFWEISLKYALGKLRLNNVVPDDLPGICEEMSFSILEFSATDAATFYRLPKLSHKDPFDRMLIWQAIRRNLTLISKDASFKEYARLGLQVAY